MPRAQGDDKNQRKSSPVGLDSSILENFFASLDSLMTAYHKKSREQTELSIKIEKNLRDEAMEESFKSRMAAIDDELKKENEGYAIRKQLVLNNLELEREHEAKRNKLLEERAAIEKEISDYNLKIAIKVQEAEERIQEIKDANYEKSLNIFDREKEYREEALKNQKKLLNINSAISEMEAERLGIQQDIEKLHKQMESTTDESEKQRLKIEESIYAVKMKTYDDALEQAEKEKQKSEESLASALEKSKEMEKLISRTTGADAVSYYEVRANETSAQIDAKKVENATLSAEASIVQDQIDEAKSSGEDTTELEARLQELTDAMRSNDSELSDLRSQLLDYEKAQIEATEVVDANTRAQDMYGDLVKANAQSKKDKDNKKAEKDAKKIFKEMLKANYWEGNDDAAKGEMQKAINENALNELKDTLGEKFGADNLKAKAAEGLAQFNDSIDKNIATFYEYQAEAESRLQGSDESYSKVLKKMSGLLIANPFVKQEAMLDKIKTAVDLGIAYNLDLRAFLGTVSDSIASTFDAFDASLLKIVRLQQADTTAARLGMEASLTKLFNQYFADSNYMKEVADGVRDALLESESLLSHEAALEFEYMVQKWMGALYSVGFSQDSINQIAQGINYLGTGNVEALNGNDQLNTLMAMSASKAGLSYGDILLNGMNAKDTNLLLKSMVEYLAEIAQSTDSSNVTKSAYTNIFGMNMADIRALQNLNTSDISNLYGEVVSYGDAMSELQYQFTQIAGRTHMSQWIDNMISNAQIAAAVGIGDNPALYGLWKVLGIVEGLTGGIHIPAFSVMGNMVDLSQFTIEGIAKSGVAGLGMLGGLLGALAGGGGLNPFSLDAWGFDETTSRGTRRKGIASGINTGVSESNEMNMTTSSSGDDVKNTGMSDKTDESKEDSKTTNKDVEGEGDIYKQIYAAIADDSTSVLKEVIKLGEVTPSIITTVAGILPCLTAIQELVGAERVFYSDAKADSALLSSLNSIPIALTTALAGIATVSGSHALGLDRVPFDGYIAELHEGEAVLTKEQAEIWRSTDSIVSVNDAISSAIVTRDLLTSQILSMNEHHNYDDILSSITTLTDSVTNKIGESTQSETSLSASVREFTGSIVSLKGAVSEQQSTVESIKAVNSHQNTVDAISTLSALNSVSQLSIGQSNIELQRALQEESYKKLVAINSTKVGSTNEQPSTLMGSSSPTGSIATQGSIPQPTGMSPEEFIKMLVDRLNGLGIRITDMPGTDSTSPLYTIGGGTP